MVLAAFLLVFPLVASSEDPSMSSLVDAYSSRRPVDSATELLARMPRLDGAERDAARLLLAGDAAELVAAEAIARAEIDRRAEIRAARQAP